LLLLTFKNESNVPIDILFLKPKDKNEKLPLILYPHGGPHGSSTTIFSRESLCYLDSGYSIAQVNYRGSTGYGQDFNLSLVGYVGDYEVKDCHNAVKHLISLGYIDKEKVSFLGGSQYYHF
jgi:acylaminoacyl-peptidase